jgi:hypothetical protein
MSSADLASVTAGPGVRRAGRPTAEPAADAGPAAPRAAPPCSLESVAVGSDRYSVSYSVPEMVPPGRPGSGVSCITNGSVFASASCGCTCIIQEP